jgi:tRNA1Val (adenine37-N6)-methyltransferase
MPNSYFRFKEFTIHQQQAGMKVSTDSCLFGAWCAQELRSMDPVPATILDIGTGTGLLLLMLAQQSMARLEGVELDLPSFEQAVENIRLSKWNDRIQLYNQDIRSFRSEIQYDLIVSNPPFYESSLKSENIQRNRALHDVGLKLDELLECVEYLLKPTGFFAVLLPFQRAEPFIQMAVNSKLYLYRRMDVRQTPMHKQFRSMLLFSKKAKDLLQQEITIKDEKQHYTNDFANLLRDYYLYL